jgi:hypothetical protein
MSLGCCLENIILAAKYYKMFKGVRYYEKRKDNLVAEIFVRNPGKDSKIDKSVEKLLFAVTKRVNTRGLFESKKINKTLITKLQKLNEFSGISTSFITDKKDIKKIAKLTEEGIKRVYGRKEFRQELASWINSNFSKKAKGMPGYSLRMSNIMSILFPPLLRMFNLGSAIAKVNVISINSLPLVCVISSKSESQKTWMKIGRLAERLILEFNAKGIKSSVFIASLEVDELRKQVEKISKSRFTPQFLFCAGYMKRSQKHTPRLSLSSKLIK